MSIPYYVVDAFTSQPFSGNPAAVCLLDQWPSDPVLASIASEFNLSETAFVKKNDGRWDLRWFTPTTEVRLCGHATLAAAAVLSQDKTGSNYWEFLTCSGLLPVSRLSNGSLELNFPAREATEISRVPRELEALGAAPETVLRAEEDFLCVYESADVVRCIAPNFQKLSTLAVRGVIVTAPGQGEIDFVSRFFAPRVGVNEDPVTGSAHATLAPYWVSRVGRSSLQAEQLSRRRGRLQVTMGTDDGRVRISGNALIVAEGALNL